MPTGALESSGAVKANNALRLQCGSSRKAVLLVMFGQYPFIGAQHYVALESAIRNHSVVSGINAPLLAKMYQLAIAGLTSPVQSEGFHTSSLRGGNITLSSVTEGKTGLWLQLARVEGKAQPFLTLGQKWVMEQPVPAHGNVSTIFW